MLMDRHDANCGDLDQFKLPKNFLHRDRISGNVAVFRYPVFKEQYIYTRNLLLQQMYGSFPDECVHKRSSRRMRHLLTERGKVM